MVIEALDEETLRNISANRLRPSTFAEAGCQAAPRIGFYQLISFMER